ncbi:hypothetical protein Tco_0310498 [Tanacetum coccineum]
MSNIGCCGLEHRQGQSADYSENDCYADTTERDDSTSGTGHRTAGAGDSLTGTGYCITGTAGTCWGPAQPELPEEASSSS